MACVCLLAICGIHLVLELFWTVHTLGDMAWRHRASQTARATDQRYCMAVCTGSHGVVLRTLVAGAIGGQRVGFVLIHAAVCVLIVWCTALMHKTLLSVRLKVIATGVVTRRKLCTVVHDH